MFNHFSWQNFKNLVKQAVPDSKKDKSKGIINWQTDGSKGNDFPQQLIQNVYNSPVGSAGMKLWWEFVQGDGLLDEVAGNTIINERKGLTLDDLHSLLSIDLTLMEGLSYIQRYTSEGLPSEVMHLPFEETRLGIHDKDTDEISKIYHNPYYGIPKSFDDKLTKWYYDYNSDSKFVTAQIEAHNIEFFDKKTQSVQPPYPGQAFWRSMEKPLARVYPQPFYYSAIKSFIVDDEIPSFHERNIKNNMMPSVLINMHGDPTAPAGRQKDTDATVDKTLDQAETVGDVMDRQMKSFINEKGGVLMNWFTKEEEKATFEAFPTNSHDQAFLNLQKNTTDHIAIGTQAARILVGIETAGKLGDSNEVLNAVRIMQGRTRGMRKMLKRIYERNFKFVIDGTIKNVNPINILPDKEWGVLTLEEQRKYVKENYNIDIDLEVSDQTQADTEKIILEPSENGS